MKVSIAIALFALLGLAASETCSNADGCQTTMCDNVSEVQCVNGQCTCELRDGYCDTLQDCLDAQNWFCPAEFRHCVDNRCRCRFDI
ncbi:serine protease inhibitor Cvsi-2-like [Crassostrea virginica]